MAPTKNEVTKHEQIQEIVLNRINQLQQERGLALPANYNPTNALISARLILNQTLDKNKRPVLETCTQTSVAQALMEMVIQGLSPAKKQCYFVAYGTQLTMMRSYHGAKAVCLRVNPELKDIRAQVIYEGDKFTETIKNGLRTFEHESAFGNIDDRKILGAYAVAVDHEETVVYAESMTFEQIKKNWKKSKQGVFDSKGGLNPGTVHADFPGEMCKRTVVNRLAKLILNTSDDADLVLHESIKRTDEAEYNTSHEIESQANAGEVVDIEIGDTDAPPADEETGEILPPPQEEKPKTKPAPAKGEQIPGFDS